MKIGETVAVAVMFLLAMKQSLNNEDCYMDLPPVPVDGFGLPVSPAQSDDTAGRWVGVVGTMLLAAAALVIYNNATAAEKDHRVENDSGEEFRSPRL